jgi:6-phospho-3-hexuloisomerase
MTTFREFVKQVLAEVAQALEAVDEERVSELVQSILNAERVVVHGAGRVGLACKGFAMRLGHLGKQAFTVADSTVPPLGKKDLLILASSSGETQTVYDVGVLAKSNGVRVFLITADAQSKMANNADAVLVLKAQTKYGPGKDVRSVQPMATQFEQSLQILFDVTILLLMQATQQSQADMWARHTNLD